MTEKRSAAPRGLIVCASRHHGNTHKVAVAMAKAFDAQVVDPDAVDIADLRDYDVLGFGSGIYFGVSDPELVDLVDRMPPGAGQRVFTFSTSGSFLLPTLGTTHLRNRLRDRHYDVLGDFNCRGLDTVGLLRLVGGVNRGRPDEHDLTRATQFAEHVARQVAPVRGRRATPVGSGGAARRS